MVVIFLLLLFGLKYCTAVIYHLNVSEYERMPPIYSLDKYDSCMKNEGDTYCTAKIELFSDTPNELMSFINEYSAHSAKHYNHSLIERGICVTKRCQKIIQSHYGLREQKINEVLAECINDTIWNKYGLQTKLLSYQCDKSNELRQKDFYDYIFMCIIYVLLLLNIVGTVCDAIVRRQNHEKNNHHGLKHYLMCFSITKNWNSLVSSESADPRIRKLKGLHGIRCLVMYIFIIGHVFYMFHAYIENTHTFEEYYDYFWYKLIYNGMWSVQILFCMCGFLLMYHLLLESEKTNITWKTVPKIIMLRLWRLTPANLVYVVFIATLFRNWGTGPLWKTIVTSKVSRDCRRYWWAHLLFVNNYIPDDVFCVVQNWQLAAEVQLYVLGVCIFVATKPHRRLLVLSSLVFLGMFSMAVHIWWNDLDGLLMVTPETYRTFDSANYAVRKFSHVNIPGFMIGMLAGYLAYYIQKEKVDVDKYKKILGPACHFVIPSIIAIFYTGSYFYEDAEKASLAVRIIYGVTLPNILALITAFTVIALALRLSEFWTNFMEWDGWVIPSRLTYSVSLIHTFYIYNMLGTTTQLQQVSSLNHTVMHLGVAAISFISAVPYCLMIETPFNKLFKMIASKNVQEVKKEN